MPLKPVASDADAAASAPDALSRLRHSSSRLPSTPPTPPPPPTPSRESVAPDSDAPQAGCLRRRRRRLRLRPDALSRLRRPRLRRRRSPPPPPSPMPFPPPPKPRLIVRLGTLLISHSVLVSVICCVAGVLALLLLLILTKNTYIPGECRFRFLSPLTRS